MVLWRCVCHGWPRHRSEESLRLMMGKKPETKPSEAISAIARALIPPPPGEREKADLIPRGRPSGCRTIKRREHARGDLLHPEWTGASRRF
jgi:hypothetical protein